MNTEQNQATTESNERHFFKRKHINFRTDIPIDIKKEHEVTLHLFLIWFPQKSIVQEYILQKDQINKEKFPAIYEYCRQENGTCLDIFEAEEEDKELQQQHQAFLKKWKEKTALNKCRMIGGIFVAIGQGLFQSIPGIIATAAFVYFSYKATSICCQLFSKYIVPQIEFSASIVCEKLQSMCPRQEVGANHSI